VFRARTRQSLAELEDLRHLYAHNYAGEADDEYFRKTRHVLTGAAVGLTCGRRFDGRSVRLDLPYLRHYVCVVRRVLS